MHHTMFQYAENSTILAIIAYNTSAVKKAMLYVKVFFGFLVLVVVKSR